MFSDEDYEVWCAALQLPPYARAQIDNVRQSEPSRRVRSSHKNVARHYPSRKMGRAIQFESYDAPRNLDSTLRW